MRPFEEVGMLLLKLSDTQGRIFDESPEATMALHFTQVEDELGFVLSGRVLMLPATKRHEGQEQSGALAKELWFGPEVRKHGLTHCAPFGRDDGSGD
jgi:hypothetical protein